MTKETFMIEELSKEIVLLLLEVAKYGFERHFVLYGFRADG